jgi:PAS domain S-box-containing protein
MKRLKESNVRARPRSLAPGRAGWQQRRSKLAVAVEGEGDADGAPPDCCQRVLDSVQAILWLADAERGLFQYVSRRAEALLGFPTRRWLEEPGFWAAQVHPEDLERVRAVHRNAVRLRCVQECEYRMRTATGRTIWLREVVQVPEDSDRDLVGVMMDITHCRKAQEAVLQSEEQYRLLFQGNPHPMWVVDEETHAFLAVNDAATRHYGYSKEEFLGLTLMDIRSPEEAHRMLEYLGTAKPGLNHAGVWMHRKKDGTETEMEISFHGMAFAGRPARIVLAQDVTERRRTEAALRESEARLHAVLDNSPAMIFLKDLDGRYLHFNRQFERTFHRALGSAIGKTDLELFPPEEAALFRANDQKVVQAGVPMVFEEVARHDDGVHTSLVAKFPLLDERGQPYAIGGIVTDITERKQVESERTRLFSEVLTARDRLQVLSRRLVEVQEAERRHIACELHDEIGQVLNALKLNLELAMQRPREEAPPRMEMAQREVNRLIQRVRELSLDLRPALLDDLGLLPALLWHFERYTRRTGVQVKFTHRGLEYRRLPQDLETAAYRITQEALTNVVRHAKTQTVTVFCCIQREQLLLDIEDQGAGFDFTAGLAAGNSTGLSGMRERVTLLGGEIAFQSAPGQGTRILATFPVPPAAAASPAK